MVMAVRASMFGQTGVDEPQRIEQFGSGSERAADSGYAGPLVQSQRRRNVEHFVDLGSGRLGHPPAGVG